MTELTYQSSKTYTHAHGFSCCFRQWRADSHCSKLHGYSLQIELVFEGDLDERNWVQDFGGLKDVKAYLERTFDHKTLIARDDPHMDTFMMMDSEHLIDLVIVDAVGCERFAEMIFRAVSEGHPMLKSVQVWEHAGNSAKVIRKDPVIEALKQTVHVNR